MHSRIFQVSSKPIPKNEWATSSEFYDNSQDFADYIGDEVEGDDRKDEIKYLAEHLDDLFDLDEKHMTLVYKGGMDKFKKQWAAAIRKAAREVTAQNVMESSSRYTLESICGKTHLESSYRFQINEYCNYAAPMQDLIEWIGYKKFKPGKKLYIGAVIDYHC